MLERKRHTKMRPLFRRVLGGVAIAAALYSCASVGRIEGGPYDETPCLFLLASLLFSSSSLLTSKRVCISIICCSLFCDLSDTRF